MYALRPRVNQASRNKPARHSQDEGGSRERQAHAVLEEFLLVSVFGTKDIHECAVCSAGLEKLAQLIKICGFLMQTKAYLFWKRL